MDSRIDELCELIGKEKDQQRVQELNRELLKLLDEKGEQLCSHTKKES